MFVTRQPWHPRDVLGAAQAPMRQALALARQGLGRCSPNPSVGAVLLREGRVVGQGFTAPAGGPHAEIRALAQAGPAARGAELFVTLEPCCHHGRTPPCTEALISAGITRVQVAALDPNPKVAGGGVAALRRAGIPVQVGLGGPAARRLIEPFRHWVLAERPLVLAKYAMTLDGRIASRTGDSRWVSGPPARLLVHRLRDVADAVLVGAGTVAADDPRLDTRLPEGEEGRSPLRVVVDSGGRLPLDRRVFDPALPGRTLVATVRPPAAWRRTLETRGLQVWTLPPDAAGRVSLPELLGRLAREAQTLSLLVEGGSALLGALLAAGLVDRLLAFVAPKLIGGQGAPGPVGDPGRALMAQALALPDLRWRRLGPDLMAWGRVAAPATADGAA